MLRSSSVVLLLFIQAVLVGWIGWGACPNKTEFGHIGASAYFWHTFRFDVFCVNPPLTRVVSGLPVVLCRPKYDWNCYSSRPQDRSEWAMGTTFISANSPEKIRWCFALARWSLIPLLLLGGYFGYRLSREMYGYSSAVVFLIMWCVSPLLLTWGATICPDVVAAALGLVAIYILRQWLYKPGWTRATVAGICLGLLPLTKLTWIIAFGLWPLIWCMWSVPIYLAKANKRSSPLPPLRQLAAMLIIALYVLNMGYLFDGTFRPLGKYTFNSRLLRGPEQPENQQAQGNRFSDTWLGAVPISLPADFIQGFDIQQCDFERGLPSYLRGQWADHGWWYYYLYALLLKEPVGTWCLAALAIIVTIFAQPYSASWRDEMLVLVPFIAILVIVSSQTGFSSHSRYIIPALPFLFVWISKVGRVFEMRPFTRRQLAMAATVILAVIWSASSSLTVFPHSLSYFNELAVILPTPADVSYPKPVGDNDQSILSAIQSAGPCSGPRHLLDSNIDWGQDLFYLEEWCESHPNAQPMRVAYFGSYPLTRGKIKTTGPPPTETKREEISKDADPATFGLLPGWYAVSVNEIYGRSQQYRYFLHFRPVAMAGYSIYIYRISIDEANLVRRELGLPELKKPTELQTNTTVRDGSNG